MSKGSVIVVFEPNSQISVIENSNLRFKEFINIYFSEPVYPKLGYSIFTESNVTITSPIPFTINNIKSVPQYVSTKCFNIFFQLFKIAHTG